MMREQFPTEKFSIYAQRVYCLIFTWDGVADLVLRAEIVGDLGWRAAVYSFVIFTRVAIEMMF
jgi:hypothetical protein